MSKTKPEHPTPIADQVAAILVWYAQQTGLDGGRYARARALEILLYLERTGLKLEDCRLEVVSDEFWHTRGNRVDEELFAAPIGRTQTSQRKPQHWFILPTRAAFSRSKLRGAAA